MQKYMYHNRPRMAGSSALLHDKITNPPNAAIRNVLLGGQISISYFVTIIEHMQTVCEYFTYRSKVCVVGRITHW